MKIDFSKNKNGFTLIELLVVISIIGLLSTVILVMVGDAKDKAMDKKIVQSAIQLRNALELYKEDHNNTYPGEPNWPFWVVRTNLTNGNLTFQENNLSYNQLVSMLSPYLKEKNLMDPIYTDVYSSYYYFANGSNKCTGQTKIPRYTILIHLKKESFLPTSTIGNVENQNYRCLSAPE